MQLGNLINFLVLFHKDKIMSDDETPKISITLRTIVTGPEAGCIIGRGGDVVNSIRDESGAKIKIEGSSQQERIITVDGPTDSIFKVKTQLLGESCN